jgi:LemA protein
VLVTVIIIVLAVVVVGWFLLSYNSLTRRRNQTSGAWAQIDVQLTKRHDLVPNLVEVVKGYASHEKQTFQNVSDARSAALAASGPAAKAAAEDALTSALSRVMAVAEAYPQLKASELFGQLQDQLSSIESGLAYARQYYNDAVLSYENARTTFPTMPVAALFGFQPREYFKAAAGAADPVAVSFQ